MKKVCIVGLGYVGLPLARQFVRGGAEVIGLDVDQSKVDALKAGRTYIKHIPAEEVAAMIDSGLFEPTTDFSRVSAADAIIICVPTPLSKQREPDLSYVIATAVGIAPHLSKGALVSLESTTYPGTTDGELREALEKGSGLVAGKDFHLAYSPEREDPGNVQSVETIPKLVGGFTDACRDRALEVYGTAIVSIVPVASCRVAEAAKLTENIFRSVNIAMVNELKVIFERMDIDVWDVIDAAATKPFGFMPFYPGPGLGGHCIPIDPFYLTWKAREFGKHTRFIELSGEINNGMPAYVVFKVAEALNGASKPVRGSKILVIGLAYKAGVDDMRESPSFTLMDHLAAQGAEVSYHDPFIPEIGPTREHSRWAGTRSIEWNRETLGGFDAALISTDHPDVDYQLLVDSVDTVIDTRNALAKAGIEAKDLWKA
ncbi:MAG: nucleotide sugar dehydrogenase [Verrucomicrobiales bacterium]